MNELKNLILRYGKDKVNSFTKYPSILTFHKLGEKGKLTDELTVDFNNEVIYGTEKIDGTNVRIICWGNEYLIGSREFILHYSSDLYYDPSQSIVESIHSLKLNIPLTDKFTVIYGELFGGKVSSNSKWYGQDKVGFRVFDVAVYHDLSVLNKTLPEISRWREIETDKEIIYGQNFITCNEINKIIPDFNYVPLVSINFGQLNDYSHQSVLNYLRQYISTTNVALNDNAIKKAEGLVLRNINRSKIVKIRFEDYERTLR